MLSGSSEFWAAFPPACVNLQLDTSSFTCFSLGYPPLPLPLLPRPGNKLSEMKGLFNFLLSQFPKPRALLVHRLSYPILSPSYPHPITPTPAPPALSRSRGAEGGPAALGAPEGGTFRQSSALPAEGMFHWEKDAELLSLSSSPILSSLPFLFVCLSLFLYLSPSFPSLLYLLFLSPFVLTAFYLFPLLLKNIFPSLSSVFLAEKAEQLPAILWGKCKYPGTNST